MFGRRTTAVLGLAALLACAGRQPVARAEPPRPIALHWVRGPGAEACIHGQKLAQRVAERLGRPVFVAPDQATLFVEGTVEARPDGGFQAQLSLVEADGSVVGARELSSDASECDELSDAVAVVLAVMVDPEAAAQPSPAPERDAVDGPPEKTEAAAEAASTQEERQAAPEPAPPAPSVPPRQANVLEMVVRTVSHTLPWVLGGGVAYLRQLPRRVRLRVEALAYGTHQRATEEPTAIGGRYGTDLQLLLAGAGACPTAWRSTSKEVGVELCAMLQAGALLYDDTFGLEQPESGRLPMLQMAVGVRLFWERDWLRASVGAAFVAALLRHQLEVRSPNGDPSRQLFEVGAVSADLDASVGVRF